MLEEYGNFFFKLGGRGEKLIYWGFRRGFGGRRKVKGRGEGETQQQSFD